MAEVDEIRQEARRNTRGRFEQWAKNPTCEANTLSAVHNVRLDKAAEAAGHRRQLRPVAVRHRARQPLRGRSVLRRRGRSSARRSSARGACRRARPASLTSGSRSTAAPASRSVDQALRETEAWLRRIAAEPTSAESIVAAPMIKIPKGVILPEALLIIDVGHRDDHGRRSSARHRRRGQGVPRPRRTHRSAAARLRTRPGRRLPARPASSPSQRSGLADEIDIATRRLPRLHLARLELAVRPRQRGPDLPGHPCRAGLRAAGGGRPRRRPRRRLLGRQPDAHPAGARCADGLLRGLPVVLRPRPPVPRAGA